MIEIRPVSDLRNKFTEIENVVHKGSPVYLTKNGYGSMVVLSLETYSRLVDPLEYDLDLADFAAAHDSRRLSAEEVYNSIKENINNARRR